MFHRPTSLAIAAIVFAALTIAGACGTSTPGASSGGSSAPSPPSAGPEATTRPTDAMTQQSPAPSVAATVSPTPAAPVPTPTAGTDAGSPAIAAAWANLPLTDARTGRTFTVADHAGKVIFVEPMAAWCSKCKAQQEIARDSVASLPEVVYISLGVDPGESDATLAKYADRSGFGWTYAVATRDVARALADAFGPNVLNPPATPVIVIGTDGRVSLTPFGEKSAEELLEYARAHGAAG